MTDNRNSFDTEQYLEEQAEQKIDAMAVDRLFREFDATEMRGERFVIPVSQAENESPTGPVPEGMKHPRKGERTDRVEVEFKKFGFEVTHSVDKDEVSDMVDKLGATLARSAMDEMYDNFNASWGDTPGHISEICQKAFIEASNHVEKPDTLLVSDALAKLINDRTETNMSEIAGEMRDMYDIRVLTDKFNTLRASDILVVDSDLMGYRCLRSPRQINTYTEYKKHSPAKQIYIEEEDRVIEQVVSQMWVRLAYAVVYSKAGHFVSFSSV